MARHTVNHHFNLALKAAGLKRIRVHDLRHTFATLHFALGTHVQIVSKVLGHSCVAITCDRYSHVIESMDDDAAVRLDDLLLRRAK